MVLRTCFRYHILNYLSYNGASKKTQFALIQNKKKKATETNKSNGEEKIVNGEKVTFPYKL